MAKALRVPVLVFDSKKDVEILASALQLYMRHSKKRGWSLEKIEGLRDEIRKIIVIFEKTNNN